MQWRNFAAVCSRSEFENSNSFAGGGESFAVKKIPETAIDLSQMYRFRSRCKVR